MMQIKLKNFRKKPIIEPEGVNNIYTSLITYMGKGTT
jgi:hypothetical protein